MPVRLMRVTREVPVPEDVKIEIRARKVWVEGKRGKLFRNFKHAQVEIKKITKEDGKTVILVEKRFSKKKRCAVVKTIAAHIRNLFLGVSKGFRYKMKLIYAHFPINVAVVNNNTTLEIRNYIGQKDLRIVNMWKNVKIIEPGTKDELWIEGNDIEAVSHSASQIWQSCRVHNKDIRKFLDGIYVYAKGVQDEEIPI